MSLGPVELLRGARRVVVVGASATPAKDAHEIPKYLLSKGYDVVPVNPNASEIWGRKAYSVLAEVPGPIDLVIVFRPSEEAPAIAQQAVEAGARALWLQSGIMHPRAREIAEAAGVAYVENACTRTVHSVYLR